MTNKTKWTSLAIVAIAVILIVMISAILPRLVLTPGIPLPKMGDDNSEASAIASSLDGTIPDSVVVSAILSTILILYSIWLIYKLLKKSTWNWRELVMPFLVIAGLTLFLGGMIFILTRGKRAAASPDSYTPPPVVQNVFGPPLGPLPPWLIWVAWIGLALAVCLLLFWIIQWRNSSTSSRNPLQWEAERAMQALKMGEDFRSVILRCYQQMSLVLQKERGLALEESMTAREFESRLQQRGVPSTPVHQLTQLFEFARYGNQPSTHQQERQALESLHAIVQFCGEGNQPD